MPEKEQPAAALNVTYSTHGHPVRFPFRLCTCSPCYLLPAHTWTSSLSDPSPFQPLSVSGYIQIRSTKTPFQVSTKTSPSSRSQLLHGRRKIGVRPAREVVVPVPVHVVDGDARRRRVDAGRLGGRVGKGESVAALGAEVAQRARTGVPRRAALAERRELPVRRVGLGARLEEGVCRARVVGGLDVAAVLSVWLVTTREEGILEDGGGKRTLPSATRARRWCCPSRRPGSGSWSWSRPRRDRPSRRRWGQPSG